MRRQLALLVVVSLGAAAPADAIAPPARVQVTATEFDFTLSRGTIKAGRALIELVNYGEDPHDLKLRRIGGTRVYSVQRVLPEQYRVLEARLLPGKFRLWCSIADHRARGMSATLTVKKSP